MSNIYSDSLEYLQGVHLLFDYFHQTCPRIFAEMFEKEMSKAWEENRQKGGTGVHAYIVDSVKVSCSSIIGLQ